MRSITALSRARRMLFHRNMEQSSMSRFINICGVMVLVLLTSATTLRAADALPLDEAVARQVYSVAENWVHRVRVPDAPTPIVVRDVVAVHVTIRRDGVTLGQGTAEVTDPASPPGSGGVDIMRMIQQAVGAALRRTAANFARPAELVDRAEDLVLDVQFARPVAKLTIDTLADLPEHATPSMHGLAMRHGSGWSWRFPGNSIAANTDFQGQVNRLLAGLNLPVDQIARIGKSGGPQLYRFEVIHLVRPRAGSPVTSLTRGSVLLPPVVMRGDLLSTLSKQLSEHLLGRQRTDGRFTGTYEPTSGQYTVTTAPVADSALAAYALARAAKAAGLEEAQRRDLAEAALRAVEAVAKPEATDGDENTDSIDAPQIAPTAMTLLALLETPGGGELKDERLRLASALATMHRPDGLFNTSTGPTARPAPLSSQSVAAAAFVKLHERTRQPELLEMATTVLAAIWREMTSEQAPFTMPFLVQAELELERLGQGTGHLTRFAPIAAGLWKRQVTPWNSGKTGPVAPDTVGGFTWVGEPTWQSGQVLAGLAVMLRSPELVPDSERATWIANAGLGARFLAQLAIQTPGAYYIHRPDEAVGGIRLSLWDNRQPLFATATALIAVSELQHSLEAVQDK